MRSLVWKCLIALVAFFPFSSVHSAPLASKPASKTQPTFYQASPSLVTEKAVINKNPPTLPVESEAVPPNKYIDPTVVQRGEVARPEQTLEVYDGSNIKTTGYTHYSQTNPLPSPDPESIYDFGAVSFLDENLNVVETANVSEIFCRAEETGGLEKSAPVWTAHVQKSARVVTDSYSDYLKPDSSGYTRYEIKKFYVPYAQVRTPEVAQFRHSSSIYEVLIRKAPYDYNTIRLPETTVVRFHCNPEQYPADSAK